MRFRSGQHGGRERVRRGAAADEDFGRVVGRGEREEDRRAVDGVRDADIVWDVGENRLRVGFNVIDDRLVVGDDEHLAVGERKDAKYLRGQDMAMR